MRGYLRRSEGGLSSRWRRRAPAGGNQAKRLNQSPPSPVDFVPDPRRTLVIAITLSDMPKFVPLVLYRVIHRAHTATLTSNKVVFMKILISDTFITNLSKIIT